MVYNLLSPHSSVTALEVNIYVGGRGKRNSFPSGKKLEMICHIQPDLICPDTIHQTILPAQCSGNGCASQDIWETFGIKGGRIQENEVFHFSICLIIRHLPFWKSHCWGMCSNQTHRSISSNMPSHGIDALMTAFWQNKGPHRNLDGQSQVCFTTGFQVSVSFNGSQWSV